MAGYRPGMAGRNRTGPRGPTAEEEKAHCVRMCRLGEGDQGEEKKRPLNGGCRKEAKPGEALRDGAEMYRVEGIGGSRPGGVGNY